MAFLKLEKDFFLLQKNIRNNIRCTNFCYKGHSISLDNIISKYINFLMIYRKCMFKDKLFFNFIEDIYQYTLKRNKDIANISIEVDEYAEDNFQEDIFLDYNPGKRYPKLDIVLGIISGIPIDNIKVWVEQMKGTIRNLNSSIVHTVSGFSLKK
jgi:hypothetical protein